MDIKVPHLAEGVDSGTVVSVLVKEGDAVKKDQTVVELESNKAVATISAPGDGSVAKVHVKEGDVVPVGGLLMTLGASSGAAPAPQPSAQPQPSAKQPAAPAAQQAPQTVAQQPPAQATAPADYQYESKSGFPPPASPSLRKMARELGIDLTRIRGSEHGGRITLEDVRQHMARLQAAAFSAQPGTKSAAKPSPLGIDFSKWGTVQKKPLSQLRKSISQAMSDSWQSVPRVTQFDDINIEGLMKLRKKFAAEYEKKGAKLTLLPFVIKALVQSLKEFPVFNTSLDEAAGEVIYKEYYHIGIAVDTEHGLMVPVLRDADKKNLLEISKDVAELAEKTRARKISVDEMRGGTFTISNQGGLGGRHFTPIVNKPEVAIMGLGRGFQTAVVTEGKIQAQMVLPVALSYDHRVIDGGSAARFIVYFAEALNNFKESDIALGAGKKSQPQPKGKNKKKGKK